MSTPAIIGIVDLDQDGAPSGWRAIHCHWGGFPAKSAGCCKPSTTGRLRRFSSPAALSPGWGPIPEPRGAPRCGTIPTLPSPCTTAVFPATRARETWQASAKLEIIR